MKQKTLGLVAGMSLALFPVLNVSAAGVVPEKEVKTNYASLFQTKGMLTKQVGALSTEVHTLAEEDELLPGLTKEETEEVNNYFGQVLENAEKYQPYDIEDHWAEKTLVQFNAAEFLGGYKLSDGTYELRPNNTITRAEYASTLVRILNLEQKGSTKTFKDVKKGSWYYDSVQKVVSNGIASGKTKDSFKPNDPITRAELASMTYAAFKTSVTFEGTSKTFTDVPKKHWAKNVIDTVSKTGIVGGYSDGSFKPNKTATRAEAVVMIKRALDQEVNKKETNLTLLTDASNEVRHGKMFDYIQKEDYKGMMQTMKTYTSGIAEVEWVGYLVYVSLLEGISGGKVQVKETGNPTFIVKANTDRLAVVQSQGIELTISMVDPETGEMTQEEEKVPADCNFYLKKTKDGKWKVYMMERLSGETYDIELEE